MSAAMDIIATKVKNIEHITWLLAQEGNDLLPVLGVNHAASKELVNLVGRLLLLKNNLAKLTEDSKNGCQS
jgi:hypothetical protein